MKLHPTTTQQYQTVTGYEVDWVEINAVRFDYSLVVLPEQPPIAWPVTDFGALQSSDFAPVEALAPDLLILGTGQKQRFPSPRLLAGLLGKRIGVECMDNQAACRTYNILMAEGRKVALAVILSANPTQ
ncbi:MAG: hypothetical protein RL404_12 [Pseudomonadota bacterium]|jgi:uncharacterized protein